MDSDLHRGTGAAGQPWQALVAKYQRPDLRRSLWQVANTFPLFFILLYLMYWSLAHPYWLTLLLALPAGGLLVRIAVIMHDCGHGSFFPSKPANNALGSFCGLLTFVPYHQWRFTHAVHHATSGDLDRRAITGEIIMLTVNEYLTRPRWVRLVYRIYRHPLFLLCLGPALLLVIGQRIVNPGSHRRERNAVHLTNLALLVAMVIVWLSIGLRAFLLIYGPVMLIASSTLVYLFYVQHQFEGVYWQRHQTWDYLSAALQGSSYLKLPWLLQWFTANLGVHHVHHLSPRIPNYNLQRCHDENPLFHQATVIRLLPSLKLLRLSLWDEERGRLVGFAELRRIGRQRGLTASD
jgi:acyl-lipid omega-6 desaturase (Delta-12 desaturase)